MKKVFLAGFLAAALTAAMGMTALAAEWKQDANGYWWQNDDGSYPVSTWERLDGNGDGISECYYFDGNGYMASSTFVDGYQVNENGAWVQNGTVQVKKSWEAVKNSNDPMEILKAVSEQDATMDSLDADYFMNMQMGLGGESLDMNATGNIKMKNALDERLQYVMTMDMALLGESVHTDAFYTDGWYYYNTDGQKIKMEMPYNEALSNTQIANMTAEDDLSYIRDVSMVRNGDSITVYYTADGAQLMQAADKLLQNSGMSMSDLGMNMTIDQYKGEFTVDAEGNYKQQKALMDMTLGEGTESISFHIYMEMDINAMGDAVSFAIPSTEGYTDFNTYLQNALSEAA